MSRPPSRPKALGNEFAALEARGAGGHWPAVTTSIAGTELGSGAPTIADYVSSTPGSKLRGEVAKSFANPWELGGRYGLGATIGAGSGEFLSNIARRNIAQPRAYKGETEALGTRQARTAQEMVDEINRRLSARASRQPRDNRGRFTRGEED